MRNDKSNHSGEDDLCATGHRSFFVKCGSDFYVFPLNYFLRVPLVRDTLKFLNNFNQSFLLDDVIISLKFIE